DHEIGIEGGLAEPGSGLADVSSSGPLFGVTYRRQLGSIASFGVSGDYFLFGQQDISGGLTTRARVFSLAGFLRGDFSGRGRTYMPYIFGGISLSPVKTEVTY